MGGGLVLAGPVGPASADLAQDIVSTQARLDSLNAESAAAAERYNQGRAVLDQARRDAAEAAVQLARDEMRLADLHRQADDLAAAAYRNGGASADSGIVLMLGTDEPGELLHSLGVLDQVGRHQGQVLADLRTAQTAHESSARAADGTRQAAETALVALDKDRQTVIDAAVQAQAVLADLQAKQQAEIAAAIASAKAAAEAQAVSLAVQQKAAADALAVFLSDQTAKQEAALVDLARRTAEDQAAPAPSLPAGAAGAAGNAGALSPVLGVSGPAGPGTAAPQALIAVRVALEQLGKPYIWAAAGPDAFDCSGLTMFAYAHAGILLGHYTGTQIQQGRPVTPAQLVPGDLIFFGNPIHHVGMYIGGGQMVHAPHTGDVVQISSLAGYWATEFAGATRVVG